MPGHTVPTGREELERRVLERAVEDAAFRQLLLSDPHAALSDLLGAELPQRLQVQVVQETPDSLCIVLPVDLSGLGYDAVWAMIGRRPETGKPTAPIAKP
jgi:hypothetical protein